MAETKVSNIYGSDTLAQYISTLYKDFADGRLPQEDIWKECWWNFIAQYNPKNTLTSTEGTTGRCKLFFRLTPQKVRAAHAKIMESLGLEVPFKLVPLIDTPTNEYNQQDISVFKKDIIRNQFNKIGLRDIFDTETMLLCIYGTAILKGPIFRTETEAVVEENVRQVMGLKVPMWKIPGRNYSRFRRTYQKRVVKDVVGLSIWDFFLDNNADTAEKSIGVIERHKYSPYEFQNKFFGNEEYDRENVIAAYNSACVPDDLRDLQIVKADKFVDVNPPKDLKISVLEYWGQAPYGLIKPYLKAVEEVEGQEKYNDTDIVECSVIMSGVDDDTHTLRSQNILQAKLNPTGKRIYKVCPFVKNPGSPWGIGVAESVRDSQKVINSFSRLMVDNKVLSGNGMFAIQRDLIDTRATKNGFKVYPGKIFFTKGDANAAIKPLMFPDVTAGLDVALDRFERWADEESGIPKYTQGESSSFLNKTATGMSMIINQSNVFLKTTIRNIDQYWIKPIAQEFNNLNEIDGSYPTEKNVPMDVVAMGVDSLMAKEIKFESAMKLFQVAKETDMLPYLKKQTALKVVSDLLDVKDLVVNEVEAEQIEQQLAQQAQTMSQAKLSANIDANILNALSAAERAQLVSKMGIIGDPQAPNELLMKKAQELELDTQSKIMINDRKALGKAQGQAANDILKDVMSAQPTTNGAPQEMAETEPQEPQEPSGSEEQE